MKKRYGGGDQSESENIYIQDDDGRMLNGSEGELESTKEQSVKQETCREHRHIYIYIV